MSHRAPLSLIILALSIGACVTSPPPEPPTLLESAYAAHAGDSLNVVDLSFRFRDRTFRVRRDRGLFHYERWFTDSTGVPIHDVLTNEGVFRERDGARVVMDSTTYASAESGVNSVVYFALLPYSLLDSAVRSRRLGSVKIDGHPYEKVEVTFQPEGGGRDFEDRFIYWIHAERFTMDYLAYYYFTDETGSRFRKAFNPRRVGGFLFADYLNYRAIPDVGYDGIAAYDSLFSAGTLELVSEILLEDVTVQPLEPGSLPLATPLP